jgi:hypothetical protein
LKNDSESIDLSLVTVSAQYVSPHRVSKHFFRIPPLSGFSPVSPTPCLLGGALHPLRPHYLSFIQNRSSRAILHRFTVLARAQQQQSFLLSSSIVGITDALCSASGKRV